MCKKRTGEKGKFFSDIDQQHRSWMTVNSKQSLNKVYNDE